MANSRYTSYRQASLEGSVDVLTDDIRIILANATNYTPNLTDDEFLNDIPSNARVVTSGSLTGKTSTNGIFNADNVTFASLTGSQVDYIIGYKHTGTESTSNLMWIIDTDDDLPFTPNGSDVVVNWNVNGIFQS